MVTLVPRVPTVPSRQPPRTAYLSEDRTRSRRPACAATSAPSTTSSPRSRDDEVPAASLQFVRKVSGFTKPSSANQEAFDRGVAEVSAAVHRLLDSLVTSAPAKNREVEAEKAKARSAKRYA